MQVEVADVRVMRGGGPWHAILLDVDNGPAALTRASNASLYDSAGLTAAHAALAPRACSWSGARARMIASPHGSLRRASRRRPTR